MIVSYLAVLHDAGRLLLVDDVCEGHPVGAEDSGELVDEDRVHAQRPRDGASVLTPGTAEAGQDVIAGIYMKE